MRTENSLATRFLALLLCLVMVLGMVPAGAVTAVTDEENGGVSEGGITPTDGTETTGGASTPTDGEESGTPQAPLLGTVSTYTGGTVADNGTDNITVTIEEATLDWSPANAEIGRDQAGWWVGIKVEAPAGAEADVLKNAQYQSKGSSDVTWENVTEVKSFWENKNSADTEESQYIQLWFVLTPETIEDSINKNDGNITMWYRFNWDGQGEGEDAYEQYVTFSVVPSDKIVLNKVEQTGVKFTEGSPEDQMVGSSMINVLTGGQSTSGIIRYGILDGEKLVLENGIAKIDETTGELTFKAAGMVTVQGTMVGDSTYLDGTAIYVVTAKNNWQPFRFAISNPTVTYAKDLVYGGAANPNVLEGLDENVTFAIVDGEKLVTETSVAQINAATGELTILTAGTVTVRATRAADADYVQAKAEYTLTIEKAKQTTLGADKITEFLTYDEDLKFSQGITKGESNSDLYFEITIARALDGTKLGNNEVADIDPATGELTIKRTGRLSIKVTQPEDDCYEKASITFNVVINKAKQSLSVVQKGTTKLEFSKGATFTREITKGESTGELTYKIDTTRALDKTKLPNDAVADIDPATGELTIKNPGMLTVKVTQAGDDCYEPATIYYDVIINKASQSFGFEDGESVAKYYGITEYENKIVPVKDEEAWDGEGFGTGGYTYSLSGDDIGATIDEATGKITFSGSEPKTGTVTVTVVKAADDFYAECKSSYTLTVSYLTTDVKPAVDGNKLNDSGWYTGNVVIQAPEGYSIIEADALSTGEWKDKIAFNEEGANKSLNVYLKDANGSITDIIAVTGINIDTGSPENLKIDYVKSPLDSALEIMSLGIYQAETLQVTISAEDSNSDIAQLTFNIGGGDIAAPAGAASYTFTINAQYRDRISMSAVDVAGNTATLQDGKILVLDTKVPTIEAGYDYTTGYYRNENGILYTNGDADILFTIEESNFDLAQKPVVTVNGDEKTVEWTKIENTDTWQGKLSLSGDGDYVVKVTFADAATNEMETYEQEVRIRSEAAKIGISYDVDDDCLNADRSATITVTEHNFKAEDFVLDVTAKDILGGDVAVMDYAAYAKNDANWTHDGDVHTLKVEFTTDAVYTLDMEYTNLSGVASKDFEAQEFTIDHTPASNIQITYSEPIIWKFLEEVTFGIYQAKAEVTITAEDITSGVDYMELTYTKADAASTINRQTVTENLQVTPSGNVFTAVYTLKAQADGRFSIVVFDKAGNRSAQSNDTRIVVDDQVPVMENVTYFFASDNHAEENGILYTQGNVDITFTINEANFNLADAPVVTVNDTQKTVAWTKVENTDNWEGKISLSGDGDYVVKVTFADAATNQMDDFEREVRIDSKAPVIEVTYKNDDALNGNCYKVEEKIVTVTVTEHNFKAEGFVLDVTAEDILGDDVAVMDYAAYAKDDANWTHDGDVHTLELTFSTDAIYTFDVSYTDLAGNAAADFDPQTFVIDDTPADPIQITYSTPVLEKIIEKLSFGFYEAKAEVTVTAEDMTSGVDYFELTYTRDPEASENHTDNFKETLKAQPAGDAKTFTATYPLNAQARGSFSVKVYDRAGNDSAADDAGRVIVTDTVSPEISVDFAPVSLDTIVDFRDSSVAKVETFAEAHTAYYNGDVMATITVTEANFFEGKLSENDEVIHEIIIKVTKTDDNGAKTVTEYLCAGAQQKVDGAQAKAITWTTQGDVHTAQIALDADGEYVLEIDYTDFSENDSVLSGNDGNTGTKTYASKTITVDKTAPVIEVTYDNNEVLNGNCYKDDRTAIITVTEHNFKAEEFDVTIISAKDILGDDVAVMDYAACAKDDVNWTHDGNVHTLKLPFTADAIYTFDVSYTDLAGNEAADFEEQSFVIDHTPADNIQITYSTPVLEKIIEKLSFGFYEAKAEVTVTAEDMTSGVDYFELTYTRDPEASENHTDNFTETLKAQPAGDAKTFTATYPLNAQARGSFSVKVYDRAGKDSYADDMGRVIVTDTVSPEIEVNFSGVDANTTVHFVDSNAADVATFAEAHTAYYNGDVMATITVNEANFFEGKLSENDEVIHELIIKVTKTDDNGAKTVTEYLCAGAQQKVEGAQAKAITWTTQGDVHTAQIALDADGEYVLEIDYTDFSKNDSVLSGNDGNAGTKTYASKTITVDKTAPVVNVQYGNKEVIYTIDGRDYFDKVQTAVITVTEHNFRAEDVAAAVTAKDVLKEDVAVADFAAQLADPNKWDGNGNVHTAEVITFSVDANYTFDFDMVDLAQNASADYEQDLFTVDRTAPAVVDVSYSMNVMDRIIESITFGYYNAKMTVTITATDDTTEIHHFIYSYINAAGVSGVNSDLKDVLIDQGIDQVGNTATATFEIPKLVLDNDNQFNGTVDFTAYNRSGLGTELKDDHRIVVDNISPTANISYNKPSGEANGISYYDGDINATIVINEANFFSQDVNVSVTKNGANYPVNVNWYNNSVDVHTGTFTLTEDGDYKVVVSYSDRSGNGMTTYTSNQLTLDTVQPEITVSNVKANSANKDNPYGFVITVQDINLDASSLKPVLSAVIKGEDGSYATKQIDLGEAQQVTAGQVYTYTVENLTEDALYTLTCSVADMSGNGMDQVVLDDGGSYQTVQFSINRGGSAYGYGDTFTGDLVEQYYVYSVNQDIVIVEVNADPIEDYTVTLNGQELAEGTDFTTEQTSNAGEWSKRTYIISKDLFTEEGEYAIIVSSVDKAQSTAYSDIKDLGVSFVVDQTAPVITISGLETGGRYQTDEQTVNLIPTDEGGRLNSLKVILLDSDGNPLKDDADADISVRFDLSGEELLTYLDENGGVVTFTIPEGLENQLQIICNDLAVNAEGTTNTYDEIFERVTVSQSGLVIFYANKPAFYGTIGGTAGAAGLIAFVLVKRKKSKEEKKAKSAT